MKLVIQRVARAKVTKVDNSEVTGQISKGLFVLLGVKRGDARTNVDALVEKLLKLRIMERKIPIESGSRSKSTEARKMNYSIKDVGGEILVVSQFTLYADCSGGNRPSFINAEDPSKARDIYDYFVKKLKTSGLKIQTGSFGDYMEIETTLDGPVTILYQ